MSNPCHCRQPSANYTNVVDYNCMENSAQLDQFFDGLLHDPNVFNENTESNFGSFTSQDWPVYNQPDFSQSYIPNNTELVFDHASTKNILYPYYPSFNMTPQTTSPSFMPSPSSVASDFMLESLPVTPECEAIDSPAPQAALMDYPLNKYYLPVYEDSVVYTQVNIEPVLEYTELLEPPVNMIRRNKITRRRTNTQQLKCPVCVKEFSRPYNLKSHLRIHTNDRPFICQHEGCKWTFARPHDLKRHQMLHTGIKPFKCSCGKKFARSDAYKRHWKVDAACIARRAELGLNMFL